MQRKFAAGARRRLAMVALSASFAVVPTTAASDARPSAHPILGDYAGMISTADGAIDVPGTLDKLSEAHVGTYAYLICDTRSREQWRRFPAFLDGAAAHKIKVWAYLCPPSESADAAGHPTIVPFAWDYRRWATELATLSLHHPALTAFAIDDFPQNLPGSKYAVAFTPSSTAAMRSAARTINPSFEFWPVVYYPSLVGRSSILPRYGRTLDGVIFPFRNDPAIDTTVSSTAAAQIRRVRQALPPRAGLVVMAYAYHLSTVPPESNPTPDYTAAVIGTAVDLARTGIDDGAMVYQLNLTAIDTPKSSGATLAGIKALYSRHAPGTRS